MARPVHDGSRVVLLSAALTATAASAVLTLVAGSSPDEAAPRVLGTKQTQTPTPAPNGNGDGNNGNGLGNGGGAKLGFTLAATVGGLVPGVPAQLPVVVTNPDKNNGTLTVKTLFVVPRDVPGCAGANLTVTPYDATLPGATPYVIARGASATVPLTVVLSDSAATNQDGCRGTTVPLTVNGVGDLAR